MTVSTFYGATVTGYDYPNSNNTLPSRALGAPDSTQASSGSSTSTAYIRVSFDMSSIPDNATINSVTVGCWSSKENSGSVTHWLQTFLGSSTTKRDEYTFAAISGNSSSSYALRSGSVTGLTAAQVKTLQLRYEARYDGNFGTNIRWDAFQVVVDWSEAVTSRSKRWTGTAWVDAFAKRWTGSAWVDAEIHRVGE
jgi:hypothetical protein